RAPALFLLGSLLAASPGLAQRPSVSAPLARVLSRDSTYTVWLFVRPGVTLSAASQSLAAAGATARVSSRWLHAVSATASSATLRVLSQSALFRRIQPLGWWRRPPGPDPASPVPATRLFGPDTCGAAGDPTYGPSEMPYRQLGLRTLADHGVDG